MKQGDGNARNRRSTEKSVQLYSTGTARAEQTSAARDLQDGDVALREINILFTQMYSDTGRPSIAPERLLRAQTLQIPYTDRSERQLMEQIDFNLLFRWFVGLDDEV